MLIGADITNLNRLQTLGAPVAFDGVFLTGVVAVLLSGWGERPG